MTLPLNLRLFIIAALVGLAVSFVAAHGINILGASVNPAIPAAAGVIGAAVVAARRRTTPAPKRGRPPARNDLGALLRNPHEFSRVADNLAEGILLVDREHRITYWNRSAEELTGYSWSEMVGTDCRDALLIHADVEGADTCGRSCPLVATDPQEEIRDVEVYLRHKDGHRIAITARMLPLTDDDGRIRGGVEILSDQPPRLLTALRVRELERTARMDPVTRLANREHIEEEVAARLAELERYRQPFGIVALDIDGLEGINERYGHTVGDEVLRAVARTLLLGSRASDVPGRLDGDTFVVIAINLDEDGLALLADRIRALVDESELPWAKDLIRINVSTGATMARLGDTRDSLVSRAVKAIAEEVAEAAPVPDGSIEPTD